MIQQKGFHANVTLVIVKCRTNSDADGGGIPFAVDPAQQA